MVSAQRGRIIGTGMIGNVLEWYDFAIYGYFLSQPTYRGELGHGHGLRVNASEPDFAASEAQRGLWRRKLQL
jgi:hypothetical protein